MKKTLPAIAGLLVLSCLLSMRPAEKWLPLLDKDLSKWQTYLSYSHKTDYSGKVPLDEAGNPVPPIGYDKDEKKVFSVLNETSGPVLKVSGEVYGCLISRDSYKNYQLKLQVRWGDKKWDPRKAKLKDSGILYHSIGDAGAEYFRTWMMSQEFQIMEGHMGDYWCQSKSAIDIRSFQSEGVMSPVADAGQPFAAFGPGYNNFCMRSANYESAAGEWTTIELVCFEGQSLHIVNGKVVMILKNSRHIGTDGKPTPMTSGKIQIQSEAAEVFYREIRIRQLDAMPEEYRKYFL